MNKFERAMLTFFQIIIKVAAPSNNLRSEMLMMIMICIGKSTPKNLKIKMMIRMILLWVRTTFRFI